MTNHVHLLLTPQRADGLSNLMQSLGRRYVRHINYTYRRSGTLWEGRFKSVLIESGPYLLTLQGYIKLNPVRAGMINSPGIYRWSSYQANARGPTNPLLAPHPLCLSLDSNTASPQTTYQTLFSAHLGDETLASMRTASQGSWPLGNDRLKAEIELILKRRPTRLPQGGDRRSQAFRERGKA